MTKVFHNGKSEQERYYDKNGAVYLGIDYSITYYNDDRKDYISFCQWNDGQTLDVPDVDTLWNSTYKGMAFSDLWKSVKYEDIALYKKWRQSSHPPYLFTSH